MPTTLGLSAPPHSKPLYGTFLIWVMLVLGGSGSNKGAILGSFVVWGIWAGTDFLTGYLPFTATQAASLRIIIVAVLLDVILLCRPQGLLRREPPPESRASRDK